MSDDNNEKCPHCGVSLQGDPIPEEHRENYGNHTHYGRKIGIEIQGVYDGVLYWQCPDCGGAWHRWDDPSMRRRAQRYIDNQNIKAYSIEKNENRTNDSQ